MAAQVWTLHGRPEQKLELHLGAGSDAAKAWADSLGGGVTVSVGKNLPKPSLPPATWLGGAKGKHAIAVAVPVHPKPNNLGQLGAHQPHEAPGLLAKAYTGALSLAAERDLKRVAFPALGCGGRA